MNSNNIRRKHTFRSTVMPDFPLRARSDASERADQPAAEIGNPDSEKYLLDSRLRGNDSKEGLPMGNINQRAGITLVEIVVAAFFLILSLTALLLLFSRTTHSAEAARRQLQALQVVRTELEQFRETTYSNITSYAATSLTNAFFVPFEGKKQCVVLETNGYKEIKMIISWKSASGSGDQIVSQTVSTIICSTN